MPEDTLSIDLETYSTADLKKVGGSRYSRDPSTEVLMAAYSFNDGPVEQWVPAEGEPVAARLIEALQSPDVVKWAWNAAFEINILSQKVCPIKVEQWRCSMVAASSCSLPASLDTAGRVLGIGDDVKKMDDGARLIRKFSMPRKETKKDSRNRVMWDEAPEDWERYKEYNRRDVLAERAILRRLKPFLPSDAEWALWHLDQKINMAGIPINIRMVRNALKVYGEISDFSSKRLKDITGLSNPNSQVQFLKWLKEQGYPFNDCRASNIKRAKERAPEDVEAGKRRNYVEALSIRQDVSKSSIKKYHALIRATDDDGNLRGAFQFCAAGRTGRWGGRLFQPQNLPRPDKALEKGLESHARNVEFLDAESLSLIYPSVFSLLSSTVRPVAQAPEGYVFVDADLSAIENIVLGWLSGCEKILNVFENGLDPYIAFAVYLFGGSYADLWAEYKAGDSSKRTISKPGVLGCGFMLGPGEERVNRDTGEKEATGLLGYAWNMGVKDFTIDDSRKSVETFRREFSEVVDYWYGVTKAATLCIRTGRPVAFGHVTFDIHGPFLRTRLPSGRFLHYLNPRLEQKETPWGELRTQISYEGYNLSRQWVRITTHPGKVTENIVQAVARDILANGMMAAHMAGLDIRIHVHDQIVALVPENQVEWGLRVLKESMGTPPSWGEGMPLKTSAFSSKVFLKD